MWNKGTVIFYRNHEILLICVYFTSTYFLHLRCRKTIYLISHMIKFIKQRGYNVFIVTDFGLLNSLIMKINHFWKEMFS